MKKGLFRSTIPVVFILTLLFAGFDVINGQELQTKELTQKEGTKLAKEIASGYKPWNKAGLEGKISGSMLPVSANIKIYMERGELMLVSVRAPFVGEAFRIEADKERIMIINKMNKCYSELPIEGRTDLLEQVQSLLLGRVVIFGRGELDAKNGKGLKFYALDSVDEISPEADCADPGWLIMPDSGSEEINYVYSVDSEYRITGVILNILRETIHSLNLNNYDAEALQLNEYETIAECDVVWKGDKTTTSLIGHVYNQDVAFTLNFDAPQYGTRGFERFTLTSKFKKVGIKRIF